MIMSPKKGPSRLGPNHVGISPQSTMGTIWDILFSVHLDHRPWVSAKIFIYIWWAGNIKHNTREPKPSYYNSKNDPLLKCLYDINLK